MRRKPTAGWRLVRPVVESGSRRAADQTVPRVRAVRYPRPGFRWTRLRGAQPGHGSHVYGDFTARRQRPGRRTLQIRRGGTDRGDLGQVLRGPAKREAEDPFRNALTSPLATQHGAAGQSGGTSFSWTSEDTSRDREEAQARRVGPAASGPVSVSPKGGASHHGQGTGVSERASGRARSSSSHAPKSQRGRNPSSRPMACIG